MTAQICKKLFLAWDIQILIISHTLPYAAKICGNAIKRNISGLLPEEVIHTILINKAVSKLCNVLLKDLFVMHL